MKSSSPSGRRWLILMLGSNCTWTSRVRRRLSGTTLPAGCSYWLPTVPSPNRIHRPLPQRDVDSLALQNYILSWLILTFPLVSFSTTPKALFLVFFSSFYEFSRSVPSMTGINSYHVLRCLKSGSTAPTVLTLGAS